jgi:hypothetical protein
MFGRTKKLDQVLAALNQAASAMRELAARQQQPSTADQLVGAIGKSLEILPSMVEQMGRMSATMLDAYQRARVSGAKSVAGRAGARAKKSVERTIEQMAAACPECAEQAKGIPFADRTDTEHRAVHARNHEARLAALLTQREANGSVPAVS